MHVSRKRIRDFDLLGPSLEASWSPLGSLLALLDAILGRLGTLLGLSRGVLEASRQLENEHGTHPTTKHEAANFHAWGVFQRNLQA